LKSRARAYRDFIDLPAIQRFVAAAALGLSSGLVITGVKFDLLRAALGLVSVTAILGYVMTVDDYYDKGIDGQNVRKKRVLIDKITTGEAKATVLVLLAVALASSVLVSVQLALVIVGIWLVGTTYTTPPVRYKRFYPFSTIGELFGFGCLSFIAGIAIVAPILWVGVGLSVLVMLANSYWRFEHEVRMVEFNRNTGKKTFAVVHGVNATKRLMTIVLVLTALGTLAVVALGSFPVLFKVFLVSYQLIALFLPYRYLKGRLRPLRNLLSSVWGFLFAITVLAFEL
jgi:4-hydroxybenzoate polyprenyltransferase